METFCKITDELKSVYQAYLSSDIDDKIEKLQNKLSDSAIAYGQYRNTTLYYNLDFKRPKNNSYNSWHYCEHETYWTTVFSNTKNNNPLYNLWEEYNDYKDDVLGTNYLTSTGYPNNLLKKSYSDIDFFIKESSENCVTSYAIARLHIPPIPDLSFAEEDISNFFIFSNFEGHHFLSYDNLFNKAFCRMAKAYTNHIKDLWLSARRYFNGLFRFRRFVNRNLFFSFYLKIKEIKNFFLNKKQLTALFKKMEFLRLITFPCYLSGIYSHIDSLGRLASIDLVKRVERKEKWKKRKLISMISGMISTFKKLMKNQILKLSTAGKSRVADMAAGRLHYIRICYLQLAFSSLQLRHY